MRSKYAVVLNHAVGRSRPLPPETKWENAQISCFILISIWIFMNKIYMAIVWNFILV